MNRILGTCPTHSLKAYLPGMLTRTYPTETFQESYGGHTLDTRSTYHTVDIYLALILCISGGSEDICEPPAAGVP